MVENYLKCVKEKTLLFVKKIQNLRKIIFLIILQFYKKLFFYMTIFEDY